MVCRSLSPKEITETHAARHESGGANIPAVRAGAVSVPSRFTRIAAARWLPCQRFPTATASANAEQRARATQQPADSATR